jgi:hypothetical protein
MQGVQIAQQAHDLAEEKYELSLEKQRKMQAALLQVQTKLKALQENGKTLVRFFLLYQALSQY